jgi:hypothetical protein
LAVKIGENIKFQMSAAIMKGYAYFKNGTKGLSKDCKHIVLNLFKSFSAGEGQGKTTLFPR